MKKLLPIIGLLFSVNVFAENKLAVDLTLDQLKFQKPPRGIGRAGILNFKSANVFNNGIILNINNDSQFFNSQIFLRPTFLGFTTQFGDYGFTLEDGSLFNAIEKIELEKSKLILDDNQLNLAGESLKFINTDINLSLNNFRLYCQSPIVMSEANPTSTEPSPPADFVKLCSSYLTLNGTYTTANEPAVLVYKSLDKLTGDKTDLQAKVKSIDLRSNQIQLNLATLKTTSNDSYTIAASSIDAKCAKDPESSEIKTDKIMKDCLNAIKIAPLKASLTDKAAKTNFNLDIKDVTIKDKIAYFAMNSAVLSDPKSTTTLSNLLLNCKKDLDTDLFEVMSVIKDCMSYGRVSISEVRSTKEGEDKASSVKKIAISSAANILLVQADIKLLGFTSRVSIHGNLSVNEAKKQVILKVTDTKLPLGLTSVKILMYFLKKNFISKDIAYVNNNIIISL